MLRELKSFEAGRMSIEELIEVSALGRAYRAEFEALSVEAPEWIDAQIASLRREIKSRNHDAKAASLRAAKARLETLKSPDEKRAALAAEIEKLEAQLKEA